MKTILLVLLVILLPIKTKEFTVPKISFTAYDKWSEFAKFKKILAMAESSNNPDTVSVNGYKGLYQFGRLACRDIDVSYDSLLNPRVSDTALVRYMRKNEQYMKGYDKFIGKTINGIKITRAGVLAGAHQIGHVWALQYLKSNGRINKQDGNKRPVEYYFKIMQDVNLIYY